MSSETLSAMERAAEAVADALCRIIDETDQWTLVSGPTSEQSEKAAHAAILAYLQALAEDKQFMADAAFNAFADEWKKGPGPAREAQWKEENLIWLENAKSFLRTLIERAQGDTK